MRIFIRVWKWFTCPAEDPAYIRISDRVAQHEASGNRGCPICAQSMCLDEPDDDTYTDDHDPATDADFAFAWFLLVRDKGRCTEAECIPCQIVTETIDRMV